MKVGQVSTQPTQGIRTDSSVEMKEGEIVTSTIKERLPNNEAILQIRGKDVQVKFEGSVPSGDKVTVQVVKSDGDLPKVKAVTDGGKGQSVDADLAKILRSLGVSPTPELRVALKYALDQGFPLDKAAVTNLTAFLEKYPGEIKQKLETVKMIINKGVEITPLHLNSVHEALNGKPIGQQLMDIVTSLGLDPTSSPFEAKSTVPEILKQIKEIVQQEPNLEKALKLVREHLANVPHLDRELTIKLERALSEAQQLLQLGREGSAQVRVNQAIQLVEMKSSEVPASTTQIDSQTASLQQGDTDKRIGTDSMDERLTSFQLGEELVAGIPTGARDIAITHITKRMAQATVEFKELKREAARNLDILLRFTDGMKHNVYPQVKEMIQSTIDIIDKAILKSDFIMFADMETEKKMLGMSMDLATAKKLVANGENAQAATILQEIKTKLEKLNWRPADVKIRHMVDQFPNETNPVKEVVKHHVDPFLGSEKLDGSARNTFELFRSLGLNYDSEAAQSLVSPQSGGNEEHLQKNMKAVMMKLLHTDGNVPLDSKVDQQAKEFVQHITGQQLLSKSDTGSLQTMFFSLPFMMGAKTETVKLYVNGKKEGQKIDWENCNLYFLMDTKKIGELGILLNANNRNLSITLKNDHPGFKEKMETIANRCKGKLEEIGYNIASLQFTKLTTEPIEKKISEPTKPLAPATPKGFDFTI
ncbi:hypothetical protein [Ammoniphilus resinae]|uniref:Flagellar hook-length control protein-like C-terminal domain-containing protein n=1 Tax=Ammoniphilus resinae TaxID=861532 RepID=A0ABS4GMI5_9BACL|nr:hypothetical protein [Ammoniphilus resinae]MBP1931481.1 hypothetical protein [Ammoniphilus resinae]